jgi:MFS family permease
MESGGMAMAFMTGHIISRYGWRSAYFALSVPALVLALPFLAIVVRTRPKAAAGQETGETSQVLPGLEASEAIRTRLFWMLAVAQVTWGLSAGAVIHIVAYLIGIGYTLRFATTAFAILAGLAALGKPTMGALGDRIGGKNALGIALLLIAASHILVLGAKNEWLLVLYLVVVGISVATPTSLVPLVLAEAVGLKRFGTLYGWMQVFATLGLFGGPLIAGQVYDLTQSYRIGFEIAALIAVAGAVASFFCVAPHPVAVAPIAQPHGAGV